MLRERIKLKCDNYEVCKGHVVMAEITAKGIRNSKMRLLCFECKRELRRKMSFTKYKELNNGSK